jgi:hypothetical protein
VRLWCGLCWVLLPRRRPLLEPLLPKTGERATG